MEPTQLSADRSTALVDNSAFSSGSLLMDFEKIKAMQALAEIMSTASVTVPQHFRGKPGDCLAVIMQAAQWGMNPFAVAQKTHIVNGTLGYEAQLVNAVVQTSGAIVGGFDYEFRGEADALECRVGAVRRGQSAITWGEWLAVKSVTTKNSPLWKTNPRQQLGYLQVKNWARLYSPGAILGVYTPDELDEPIERDITSQGETIGSTSTTDRKTDTLPAYQADKFKTNLPTWKKYIDAGKKTADDIIATIASANTLTDEQRQAIRDLAKPAKPADPTADSITFDQVKDKLQRADGVDVLDVAADLIGEVADADQRAELGALYKSLRDDFLR